MVSKPVTQNQLMLSSEFNPHKVPHIYKLVPNIRYAYIFLGFMVLLKIPTCEVNFERIRTLFTDFIFQVMAVRQLNTSTSIITYTDQMGVEQYGTGK